MDVAGYRQRHWPCINWAMMGLLLVFLILAALGSGARLQTSMLDHSSGLLKQATFIRSNQSSPVHAYLMAIDLLMSRAQTQARWLKYLAIDAKSLVGADDESRKMIFANLEKYDSIITEKNRQQLEAEGYIENLTFREGYFINIQVRKMGFRSLTLDTVLYRSGAGAFGWREMTFAKQGGKWAIVNGGGWFIA